MSESLLREFVTSTAASSLIACRVSAELPPAGRDGGFNIRCIVEGAGWWDLAIILVEQLCRFGTTRMIQIRYQGIRSKRIQSK
jgi:hypothetical protein